MRSVEQLAGGIYLKKLLCLSLIALLTLTTVACSSGAEEPNLNDGAPKFLSIGTAGTGGAYYPIGISIAEITREQFGTNASAQVTGGAVENVSLLHEAEVDLAITQSPMAMAGLNGTEPYQRKNDNIATLFDNISKGIFQIVTLNSSGINSLADLKGKKVVLGPAGGGALTVINDILSVYGISTNDLKGVYVSYNEGITMLSDNNVDAVLIQSAAPASAVMELAASSNDFKILSIEKDKQEELISKFGYLKQIKLPKDMYGTPQDISTVYLTNMMIVRKDLDENFVYKLTKAIFENLEKVQASHPSAKGLSLESQGATPPIPLHPGAQRYFEEQGVLE